MSADNEQQDTGEHHIEMHQQLQHQQEAGTDNHNLFENNAHHDTQDRAEFPAKDATLEPESDDELFINEGPALSDDNEEYDNESYPRDNFDDSSNFIDEEDTTYGSPGLREAFNNGYLAGAQDQLEQDSSRAGSVENGRKNKRKQFKPRNIVYSMNDESDNEGAGVSTEHNNSPMDLSVPARGVSDNPESDSDSEGSQAANQTKPKPGGLSVVRPEILFGDNKVPASTNNDLGSSQPPQLNPLSLLSNLSGLPPGLSLLNKALEQGSGNNIQSEFKEMLKLFGVSPEIAENLIPSNPSLEQRKGKTYFW